MTINGKAYIAGAYEHPTRKAPDKSVAQLHGEVMLGALADAGLSKSDVDGYFCAGDAPGMGPLGELLVDRGTGRIGDLHEQRAGCIYIHAVTQLEISSTEVRQLIAMGRDPRFLMPDSVRKLILDTRCYAKSRTP